MAERGRPQQREAFLTGAVEYVLGHGASGLSLRPLAAALGTSDRMLLYYFGSREHLLEAVLDRVGDGLVAALSHAVADGRSDPQVLLRAVWSTARHPDAEPVLRLYLEILGQAAARVAPFPAAARRVAHRWLEWVEDRVDVPVAERPDTAAALLAAVDGLLLLHLAVGSEVADGAARRLLHGEDVAGVVRLVTLVDVHEVVADNRQMSVSARHEAVLADGRRLLLLDDRGWSVSGPPDIWAVMSASEIRETARAVVGPDEPFGGRSQADMVADHWSQLGETLRRQGVVVNAQELQRLPHEVVLSERLLARLGRNPGDTVPP